MQNCLRLLLWILLLCSSVFAANDFTGDSDFIALYNMESLATLRDDAIGAADMDLNSSNAPDVDLVDFKQGVGCGVFDSSNTEAMGIDSPDTAEDMPFKRNANRVGTLFCWFKPADFAANIILGGRYQAVVGGRAFFMGVTTSAEVRIAIGYSVGNSVEVHDLSQTLTVDTWNHVAMSYDVADDSYHIRLFNGGDSTVYDVTGTTSNTMSLQGNTFDYSIGGAGNNASHFNGRIDEFGFCKRIVVNDDIDDIRNGVYGASSTGQMIIISDTYWEKFLLDGINGKWSMAA